MFRLEKCLTEMRRIIVVRNTVLKREGCVLLDTCVQAEDGVNLFILSLSPLLVTHVFLIVKMFCLITTL